VPPDQYSKQSWETNLPLYKSFKNVLQKTQRQIARVNTSLTKSVFFLREMKCFHHFQKKISTSVKGKRASVIKSHKKIHFRQQRTISSSNVFHGEAMVTALKLNF